MKTLHFSLVKTVASILLLMVSTWIFAQKNTTWKGGTPGMETAWECPKNWSNYQVPDEFSNVIIPVVSTTTFAYPIIENGIVKINALHLESEAKLTIVENSRLVVYTYSSGLENVSGTYFLIKEQEESASHLATALRQQN